MTSEWGRHLVNLRQSSEERKAKYRLARHLGATWQWASVYRDWRWDKIARRFGHRDFEHLKEALEND